jgi:hypothetical protein
MSLSLSSESNLKLHYESDMKQSESESVLGPAPRHSLSLRSINNQNHDLNDSNYSSIIQSQSESGLDMLTQITHFSHILLDSDSELHNPYNYTSTNHVLCCGMTYYRKRYYKLLSQSITQSYSDHSLTSNNNGPDDTITLKNYSHKVYYDAYRLQYLELLEECGRKKYKVVSFNNNNTSDSQGLLIATAAQSTNININNTKLNNYTTATTKFNNYNNNNNNNNLNADYHDGKKDINEHDTTDNNNNNNNNNNDILNSYSRYGKHIKTSFAKEGAMTIFEELGVECHWDCVDYIFVDYLQLSKKWMEKTYYSLLFEVFPSLISLKVITDNTYIYLPNVRSTKNNLLQKFYGKYGKYIHYINIEAKQYPLYVAASKLKLYDDPELQEFHNNCMNWLDINHPFVVVRFHDTYKLNIS